MLNAEGDFSIQHSSVSNVPRLIIEGHESSGGIRETEVGAGGSRAHPEEISRTTRSIHDHLGPSHRSPVHRGRSAGLDYARDLNNPGEFPYTRGIHPTGYRGKLWTMRQFAGFGTPEETNERYKTLLKAGGTGLSVAFDLPTLDGA